LAETANSSRSLTEFEQRFGDEAACVEYPHRAEGKAFVFQPLLRQDQSLAA
jgi:hypothetical protein